MPEPTCPSCGFLLDVRHNYCPSCGARTTGASVAGPRTDEDHSRRRLQRAVGTDYRVGPMIGRGGFAEVFEATDTRLDRRVAIKVVRPDLVGSTQLLQRFQREARAVAGLRHPHVMEIYTVGEHDGVAYFVMPLIDGESLRERIERDGPLPVQDAERILIEAASALEAAHRAGTVHRDVKPDNILLEGPEGRVQIADFGIARALEADTGGLTGSGVFVGTPRYMSPEQATGDPLDHRSDIYSLGVVAFHMIAGVPPFEARSLQALVAKHLTQPAPSLRTLRPECPERLARVVERCLAKDAGDRWESLAELVGAMESGSHLDASAERTGPPRLADPRASPAVADPTTDGEAAVDLLAPLRSFRLGTLKVTTAVLVVVIADVALGLGGLSVWAALGAVLHMTLRASRLWNEGYEWRDLLVSPELGDDSGPVAVDAHLGTLDGQDFGRFGSLVRSCTSERAAIMKAFALVSHQEQERFPELRETVEVLVGRVKHLARKVVTLEDRIAETAVRHEPGRAVGSGVDPELAESSVSRHAARLQELNGARDEAAAEMHSCVSKLEEVHETLTEQVRLDPARGLDELGRTLADVVEYLGQRAG